MKDLLNNEESLQELLDNEERLQEVLEVSDRITVVSARLARNIKTLAEKNK